jgi:hypothetical protein
MSQNAARARKPRRAFSAAQMRLIFEAPNRMMRRF